MAYIYRHIRPDKNEPFYIGIGITKHRLHSKHDRNKHWKNIVNLNEGNYRAQILQDDLTWEEAKKREIEFIALYGRSDLKKGPLCNLTDGGEGNTGYIVSEETRKKISQNNARTWLGKTRPEETNEKIRLAHMGMTCSPEHCKNIGLSKTGEKGPNWGKFGKDHVTSKSILCVTTGVQYEGVSDAARKLNLNIGHIASVARGLLPYTGSKKYPGGLKFVYN